MPIRSTAAVLGACALLGAMPALAQDAGYSTRGPRLGVRGNHASIELTDAEDPSPESGLGGGVSLGWGFSDRLSAFARGDLSSIDYAATTSGEHYSLAQLDLGGRFAAGHRTGALRPYVALAVSYVIVSDNLEGADYTFTGAGLTGGVGAEYFFARRLSAELEVGATRGKLTDGEFNGETVDPDANFTATRIGIGVNFRPRGVRR